jgi:hypothetical protein
MSLSQATLLVLIVGAAVVPCFAGDGVMMPKAGLWEVTSIYEPPGGVFSMPIPIAPKIARACLADGEFASKKFPAQAMPACEISDAVLTSGSLNLTMSCINPYVKNAVGNLTVSSERVISGHILVSLGKNTDGKEETLSYRIDAKRLGDCDSEVSK